MFFFVGKTPNDRFSYQWTYADLVIGTDAGWINVDLDRYWVLYKGYCDDGIIHDHLAEIIKSPLPTRTGNFCVLIWDKQDLCFQIRHDIYRSFPVYYVAGTCITNHLQPDGSDRIHTNNRLICDQDLVGEISSFDIDPEPLLTCVTAEDIRDFLGVKIQKFCAQNPLPLRIYLSGGVDTLLIFSFLKQLRIDFELVMSHHVDLDDFMLRNYPDVPNWSYRQINHWRDPCVLAVGTPGDEFTLRSPTYVNWFCLQQGRDIRDLVKNNPHYLMYEYFCSDKSSRLFDQQAQSFADIKDLRTHSMNIIANDYQHYHLGHTITWTPLRDLRLFDMFCHLSPDDQIHQILDSKISKDIIEMNVPGLSQVLSDQKNQSRVLNNLRKLDQYHAFG